MPVLNYLYVFWVSTLFILTMIPAFLLLMPGFLLPPMMANRYSNFILAWWATIWGIISFMPMRTKGRKKNNLKGPMVIVTNHNSFLDTPASYASIPIVFKTLAKKELTKIPIMGQIFLTSGIMVDRKSPESRKASYNRMVKGIKDGTSIMIYPEGTQNRTDQPLKSFYDGAFKLAVECQVPILPICTLNTRWMMPQAQVGKMKPGTITQVFLDPIPTTGMTAADVPQLSEKVHQQIEAVLRKEDPHWAE